MLRWIFRPRRTDFATDFAAEVFVLCFPKGKDGFCEGSQRRPNAMISRRMVWFRASPSFKLSHCEATNLLQAPKRRKIKIRFDLLSGFSEKPIF